MQRPESPRNLQTGEIINKMKYRPLPPPPRPPRDKRTRGSRSLSQQATEDFDDRDGGGERIATSSTADSYEQSSEQEETPIPEVEVSVQTDPLPYEFEYADFEITPDMKIIVPTRSRKTLEQLMQEEQKNASENVEQILSEDEQLARGLQRFRDANQRSMSERSRASSQAEQSRTQSRPQTPSSAIIIERRISSPVPSQQGEGLVEAALIVRPIDELDLEEEELRREGLLTDSSQQSKSDVEESKLGLSDFSQGPSSVEVSEVEAESEKEPETEKYVDNKSSDEHYDEDENISMDDIDIQAELEKIRQEELAETDELQLEIEKLLKGGKEIYEETEEQIIEKQPIKEEKEQVPEPETEQEPEQRQLKQQEFEKEKEREKEAEKENVVLEKTISQLQPQPPPRRKSASNIEIPSPPLLDLVEHQATLVEMPKPQLQFPTHISDLEVERLRVHALQAGQIMVSQLHGTQISSDELECKSGSLIVKNLELPANFIEDIVERVRSSERGQLHTSETQTSQEKLLDENETVRELIPPPKPPRQRDLETAAATTTTATTTTSKYHPIEIPHENLDEQTQTDLQLGVISPPVFPTIEYLQTLAPLAFYNYERQAAEGNEEARAHHHHHHHHRHYRKCESSNSETEETNIQHETDTSQPHAPIRRRQRTRSPTEHISTGDESTGNLTQASRQFISACSLSLVKVINQLTTSILPVDKEAAAGDTRLRQIPQQIVLLFVVIAVAVLAYMLSGRNVHTHHWDYFNPPGNEGRNS